MSKVLDLENALPAIKTWIWSHFQSLKGGTFIAKNTDLNTIMDVGNYYCPSTDYTHTLSNTPIAAANMAAFTMKVGYSTGTGYTYQELIIYNTGVRYYRYNTTTNNTSKWQAWQAFEKNSNTYTSAYCGTEAGTAAKTATCTNYVLKANSYLHITMTASNTAASELTLNVNGKGAKPIWINGSASSASNHTLPSGTYIVFYDGTNYYFNTEHGITDHLLPKGFAKTRRTTANIPSDNSAGVETFLATSAMKEGKPLGGDAKILHMNWDNSNKWASQLAICNNSMIEARTQSLNSGDDWSDWRKVAMFGAGVTPTSGKALVTEGNGGQIKTVNRMYDPVTTAEVRAAGGGLTTSDSHYAYLNALLKAICIKCPNLTSTIFYGLIEPNSLMSYEVCIYSTSNVDSNGLPRYSFGIAYNYHSSAEYGYPIHFGTSNYAFIYYREGFSALYGTCDTAAGTAEKVVTCSDFNQLFTGTVVNVKMTNSNSVANPTLNVNGTGAKPIMRYGTTAAGNNANTSWSAGTVVSFVYDGTNWLMLDFAHRENDNTYTSAYCSTAAATAAKAATCTNYALLTNSYLHVTMTNANTYNGAITLNVNGKGAKPIWINGAASSSSNKTLPAGTYLVFYDGSKYMFRTDGKIDGVTAAAGTNDKTLATTAFVKKACDDATDAVVGDHLIYKVGTCVHTRENVPPSTVGTWVRTYRLDRWGYDPAYYNDEYNVGSSIEMAFSWYQVSSTNGEGLVGYFNIPGLGESGATVDDVGLSIDFGSSGEFIDVFYNGVRYRAKENTGDINRFHIRGISGDTLFFDLAGLKMTTDTSGTGTVLPDKSSGTGRIKGVGFRCSKPLYHWTRVS